MAIKISGTTVIDDSLNITNANNMYVGVVTMTGSSGDIETPGTITAGGFDFPPIPLTFDPTDGATDRGISENISITFSQSVQKGTGNITLRDGSAGGTVLQTIDVTSGSVTISGATATINPPIDLTYSTNVYVVVDEGAFTGINIGTDNEIIDTYNFTTTAVQLGDAYEGGFLICVNGGVRWVVSPSSAEVSRNWYARNDTITRAQQISGCTGWFVPGWPNLQNPGFTCRTYWDSYRTNRYWSNTPCNGSHSWSVSFTTGGTDYGCSNTTVYCVRSFRCVAY